MMEWPVTHVLESVALVRGLFSKTSSHGYLRVGWTVKIVSMVWISVFHPSASPVGHERNFDCSLQVWCIAKVLRRNAFQSVPCLSLNISAVILLDHNRLSCRPSGKRTNPTSKWQSVSRLCQNYPSPCELWENGRLSGSPHSLKHHAIMPKENKRERERERERERTREKEEKLEEFEPLFNMTYKTTKTHLF